MSVNSFENLIQHVGHKIVCVTYQLPEERGVVVPDNVAIECETCNEVLIDFDKPKTKRRKRV